MAYWFKAYVVTTVAIESTGVYWIPAYEVLEGHGFEVILVNARNAKNVPGRKALEINNGDDVRHLSKSPDQRETGEYA